MKKIKLMKKNQKGFTLIELMIALSILAIGILGLGKLIISSTHLSTTSFKRYLAIRQANLTKAPIENLLTFSSTGSVCYACDNTGICNKINCKNGAAATSSWLALNVKWKTPKNIRKIRLPISSRLLGDANSTVQYILLTIKAGWDDSNPKKCLKHINKCSNIVTIKKIKPLM